MIDLFTYLSFSNVNIGQLYQFFIIALLSVIILYSTYFSLSKLPTNILIKDRFFVIFVGFIVFSTWGCSLFLFIATKLLYPIMWLPVFSFIIRTLTWLVKVFCQYAWCSGSPHRPPKKVTYVIYGIYFSILQITVGLFCVPSLSSYMLSYLFKTNYAILAVDLIYLLLASIFVWSGRALSIILIIIRFKFIFGQCFHASTILFPWLIRYLVVYNLLMILSYLLIEILSFMKSFGNSECHCTSRGKQ